MTVSFWILLGAIILAVIAGIFFEIADAFDRIAVEKGYPPGKYRSLCFWLGLAGWLMVVALPDRK